MSEKQLSYYENFQEIEKKLWSLLIEAVKDRDSEFRTPVFICGDNKDLDGRVVVLRKADQKNNFVQFHSDIRSSKIKKIKKNPNCSLLFYGKKEKIQLRLKINSQINFNNDVSKKSWEKTVHMSRQCYLWDKAPGSDASEPTSGLSNDIDNLKYTIEDPGDDIFSYEFDFGDGSGITNNPFHTYDDNGEYKINIVVTDETKPTPSAAFERVLKRAAQHVQNSGKAEVKGLNILK
mgnify:CR=1 FL=1